MTDQFPPGARALLDEAVQELARGLGSEFSKERYGYLPVWREKARRLLVRIGFLDLAARAERAEDEAFLLRSERITLRDQVRTLVSDYDALEAERNEARREVERLNRRNEELEKALDIERRTRECPHCEGGENCDTCQGSGHVVMCVRCNGLGGIGPEGDRNCPECSGDGVDVDETAKQIARANQIARAALHQSRSSGGSDVHS